MSWFKREFLEPGKCECGHARCSHIGGKKKCYGQWPPDKEENKTGRWVCCSCQIYIPEKVDLEVAKT